MEIERRKFNDEFAYTRDEFVEICRELASDPDLVGEVVGYLLAWIGWAEAGLPSALIRFESANGKTYPYRVMKVSIDQKTGEVSGDGTDGFGMED